MTTYQVEHCIIGAGIAGCYVAMQLQKRSQDFVMLEQSSKPHSKLETSKLYNTMVEMGAGVFLKSNKRFHKLLHYLDLHGDVYDLPAGQTNYVANLNIPVSDQINREVQASYNYVYAKMSKASKTSKYKTVDELARTVLSKLEYNVLKTFTDAWFEIADEVASVFFKKPDSPYQKLRSGLKNVTKTAWVRFQNNLRVGCKVKSVRLNGKLYNVECNNDVVFLAKKIYVCVSLEHLPLIRWNEFQPKINTMLSVATVKPSIRYFVLFKVNLPFSVPCHTVGNILGHWWIQLHPRILMIYTDDHEAKALNQLKDEVIVHTVLAQMNKLYKLNVTPAHVDRTIRAYWPTAWEVLKPEYFKTTISLPFLCTSLPRPIDQAWMEGHLYEI